MAFEFLDYKFDNQEAVATFRYRGKDEIIFTERVQFAKYDWVQYNTEVLDRALFLAFVVLGTSYYKVQPSSEVILPCKISKAQAEFFNLVYQEGLSQFAYENHLTRADLAHFSESEVGFDMVSTPVSDVALVLLSGGKDSLLLAETLRQKNISYQTAYITSSDSYPDILEDFGKPLIIRRFIDRENLQRAEGLNGHVPITMINEALALVQAVLSGYCDIQLGLGEEGVEPHAQIGDLMVNHQWSKTSAAQKSLTNYIKTQITDSITIGSILAAYSEIEIAEQFAKLCWDKFGQRFSSCNVANYKQGTKNGELKWCGKCAKCANSYLLFAPFVAFSEQEKLFGRDLFMDPDLVEIFKGLLGVDGAMKPFECIASVAELRHAYHNRLPGYGALPFKVPKD